jgi:hypothetical protein
MDATPVSSAANHHRACCRSAATRLSTAKDFIEDASNWLQGSPERRKAQELLAAVIILTERLRYLGVDAEHEPR